MMETHGRRENEEGLVQRRSSCGGTRREPPRGDDGVRRLFTIRVGAMTAWLRDLLLVIVLLKYLFAG